jgi:tRNA pseudouridine55 synthase
MLPICFGEATKFSQFLLDSDKHYSVVVKLGVKTTTGDAEGEIVSQAPVPLLTDTYLAEILAKFCGVISQVPSMYSALKHQGRPLYELARQGIVVERAPRQVTIYQLNLLAYTEDTLTLSVKCSKGTYIRTLAEDIGEVLGCGAHAAQLRRLSVSSYQEAAMVPLSALSELAAQENHAELKAYLLPVSSAIAHLPELKISEAGLYYLRRGQSIIVPAAPTSGLVRLSRHNEEFIGVAEILDDGRVAPRRLVQE